MISPLAVVSDGYLSVTKRVLVIAVAGYLNFGGESVVPPPIQTGGIGSEEIQHTKSGGDFNSAMDSNDDEEAIIITVQSLFNTTPWL